MTGDRFLSRVIRGALSLFQDVDEPSGPAAKRDREPPSGAVPAEVPDQQGQPPQSELAQRISEVVAASGGATAAGIHTLGLDGLKSELGPRWPRLVERTHMLARRVIERHLAADEFYEQLDDETFLIIMPGLDEPRARLKIALISDRLMGLLRGADDRPLAGMRSFVGDVGGAEPGSVDAAAVDAWIEQARRRCREPEPEDLPPFPTLDDLQFVYRPLWYRERRHVTTYLCLPTVVLGERRLFIGDQVPSLWDRDATVDRIDLATLRRAMRDAREATLAGKHCLIAVPVHIYTLTGQKRLAYFAECWAMPEVVRKSIVMEVYGVTNRILPGAVEEAIGSLRHMVRAVMARGTLDGRMLSRIRIAGAMAAGLDAGDFHLPEDEVIPRLDEFAGRCTELGLLSYVHGLRSLSLLTAAVGAQFTYIGGDAISSLIEAPADNYPLDLIDMYLSR